MSEIYRSFESHIKQVPDTHHRARMEEIMKAISEPLPKPASLDAIIILGASMDRNQESNTWRLGAVVESDKHHIVGGHSRAVAAKQLLDEGFAGRYLVTGGTHIEADGLRTSRAQVLANKMQYAYKVPPSQIAVIGREGNGNTLGNIRDVREYLSQHPELINSGQLGLLTNEWHMPRSLLMFRGEPFFAQLGVTIQPLVVDKLLPARSPQHSQWVERFHNHPEMHARIQSEVTGIFDYLAGKYQSESS